MIDASRLYEPKFWAQPQQAYQLFSELRQQENLTECVCEGYPKLWHITRHSDCIAIESMPDVFESAPRMTINNQAREKAVRKITGGRPYMIKPLNAMDGREHQDMRNVLQQQFTPAKIHSLKAEITNRAATSVRHMMNSGSSIEFASQVAYDYPLGIIMPLMGIPKKDYQFLHKLTKQLFAPADPETKRPNIDLKGDPAKDMKEIHEEFRNYFAGLLNDKRKQPSKDLVSEIAKAMSTVKYMDQDSAIHYCILIATAGHDTTSYSLSEAIYQLALNNELLSRLAENPQDVSAKITEEAIRLAAPTRHFIRTANQDVTISGTTIKSGDSVILWFPSACRDESVVPEPDVLRLDRSHKVPQSAFGSGPHVCLGMHLARLELMCFLQEFAKHVKRVKLLDQPKYTESNFVGGIKSLRLEMAYI